MMRQPNGTSSSVQQSHFGNTSAGMVAQSPMLPTKSPMVTHKPLHPPPGQSPSSSSNQSVPNSVSGGNGSVPSSNMKSNLNGGDSSSVGLDKAKDSTKMFPTKTYNHIKDMISSRFGNNNSSSNSAGLPPKGLNNSNVANNNASNNTTSNQNGGNTNGGFTMNGQNGNHSYMESNSSMGMPTYGLNQHGHIHSHSIHDTFGGNPPAAPYYTSPPAVSPQNGTGNVNGGGAPNMNGNANSYRSPPMNDRKNVNTSFRKAIHQSTLKSNLTEESLQLRPIMEVSNLNGNANRDVYHRGMQQYSQPQQQNGEQGQPRYGLGHEPPSPSLIPHHVERAQRALDKLCEPGGPPFTRTGSGPMTHQNGIGRMVQQFSGSGNAVDEIGSSTNNRGMYSMNTKIGAISSASSGASQLTTGGGELGAIPRNRFSVTPGPSSSTSNSSGGLGANTLTTSASGGGGAHTVESSLSSPSSSSYTHSSSGGGSGIFNKQSLGHQQHQAPTTSLLNGNGNKSGSNNKSSTNNDQIPPPLPTSQKPEVSGASGHSHHLHFQNSSNNSSSGNNNSNNNSGSNNHHNTLGLPPVLPSVLVGEKRENGDGSSGTMENPSSANLHLVESTSSSPSSKGATCSSSSGAGPSGGGTSNASSSALAVNKSKSEQLKKITADLHNLAISVAAEQHFHHNHHHHLQFASGSGSGSGSASAPNNNQSSNNNNNSSSSECENKGSQRIGSGQSHTTSDSGVGTVMLTKSPLNSISDHETNCKSGGVGGATSADLLLGGDDHNVMDSVSSGKKSENTKLKITIKIHI